MSDADNYLLNLLVKYKVDPSTRVTAKNAFNDIISNWAGGVLESFSYSGSSAKGTEISISSDVDFFISLNSATRNNLKDIYDSLYTKLNNYSELTVRKQNVSIGVTWNNMKIDFTPGKNYAGNSNYHSLYKNKTGTWTQTNVQKHINTVLGSNRINEIKLTKIWRECHQLDWPSLYLELFVIDALRGCRQESLAINFEKVLIEVENSIKSKRFIDPSNSNNIISDDIGSWEKNRIYLQAHSSNQSRAWGNVVW